MSSRLDEDVKRKDTNTRRRSYTFASTVTATKLFVLDRGQTLCKSHFLATAASSRSSKPSLCLREDSHAPCLRDMTRHRLGARNASVNPRSLTARQIHRPRLHQQNEKTPNASRPRATSLADDRLRGQSTVTLLVRAHWLLRRKWIKLATTTTCDRLPEPCLIGPAQTIRPKSHSLTWNASSTSARTKHRGPVTRDGTRL